MTLHLEMITLKGWPFQLLGIAYGGGARLQLEVLYSKHDQIPSPTQLRSAWKSRQASRGVPLLVVVLHADKAYVCGPSGEDPTIYPNLDPGQVERICLEALEQPSRQAALRALRDSLGTLEGEGLPGLRNEGFLASHELARGVPARPDWVQAGDKARSILGNKGKDLLKSLGFTIEKLDKVTDVLRAGEQKTAIALLLNERETPESGSDRIPGTLSPVSYALSRADDENLNWVVLLHGRKIRLYPVKMGVGVGRRGRTETYLECHIGLLPDDQAAYLWLLFSADALTTYGTLASILEDSKDFAGDLAARLRERIYDEVIPRLAEGLADARGIRNPSAHDLAETYQMAMRVLFRLLFVAYGEDKDLLPYRFNGLYQKRSLKTKARDLFELAGTENSFGDGDSWWQEVRAIFRSVDKGNPSWGVPAYNGGLFSSDPKDAPIGAALDEINLPDRIFGPALQHLLLVPTAEGVLGPVDFRSLGVREFGTIYEGLLESELSVAETDLTVEVGGRNKGVYRPCRNGEEPVVPKGRVYLHNASGARKSTGSYYTKHFAVEHLLDRALEPALDDHFMRLNKLDELEAAEAFFDFRVADIAMGSGHFLVAAVDRIEARFSGYLAKRPLPEVARELDHLRRAAQEALGDASDSYPDFEDTALLRRQIARRCIYGVDINEVAVKLARLAIWIHTFVPGLPLSLLDRNLVHGNSLVGIGQLDEVHEILKKEKLWGWFGELDEWLDKAREPLSRLGKMADSSRAEIKSARATWKEAEETVAPLAALCKIVTNARIQGGNMFARPNARWKDHPELLLATPEFKDASEALVDMNDLHFPVAFPEVFLRERAGFDVILGNPPWAKARLEELKFWGRHQPGIRGLETHVRNLAVAELMKTRPDLVRLLESEKQILEGIRQAVRHMPGMNTGHPDYFRAFLYRFIQLVSSNGGRLGIVLPGDAFKIRGARELRALLARESSNAHVQLMTNRGGWVFDDVHQQKLIALLAVKTSATSGCTYFYPREFHSYESWVKESPAAAMSVGDDWLTNYSPSRVAPTMPSCNECEKTEDVFNALMSHAPLRSHQILRLARVYADFETTRDKKYWKSQGEENDWPVYKGESLDIWQPDTGQYFGWCDGVEILKRAQSRRLRSPTYHGFSSKWREDPLTHPVLSPRIAFRDVTNRTNTRTLIAALIPGERVLTQTAPWVLFDEADRCSREAALLGFLCSIPLDWWARRFIEGHADAEAFLCLRIPEMDSEEGACQRVIQLAGRLACPDERFAEWAKEIGVKHGPLDADEKQEMIHELDAVVAHLYGLKQKQLVHIFETFHVGWDYHARLKATLKHFRKWRKGSAS